MKSHHISFSCQFTLITPPQWLQFSIRSVSSEHNLLHTSYSFLLTPQSIQFSTCSPFSVLNLLHNYHIPFCHHLRPSLQRIRFSISSASSQLELLHINHIPLPYRLRHSIFEPHSISTSSAFSSGQSSSTYRSTKAFIP